MTLFQQQPTSTGQMHSRTRSELYIGSLPFLVSMAVTEFSNALFKMQASGACAPVIRALEGELIGVG